MTELLPPSSGENVSDGRPLKRCILRTGASPSSRSSRRDPPRSLSASPPPPPPMDAALPTTPLLLPANLRPCRPLASASVRAAAAPCGSKRREAPPGSEVVLRAEQAEAKAKAAAAEGSRLLTAEKARVLRRHMRAIQNWHDAMYHSAIATRLASPDEE